MSKVFEKIKEEFLEPVRLTSITETEKKPKK